MLFMTVFTYEPAQRDAVVGRRVQHGGITQKGVKVVGEWSYTGGGQVFTLVEADDPVALVEAATPWTDIGKLEAYPVIEVEKILPYLAEHVTAVSTH